MRSRDDVIMSTRGVQSYWGQVGDVILRPMGEVIMRSSE